MNEAVYITTSMITSMLNDDELLSVWNAAQTTGKLDPEALGYKKAKSLFRNGIHRDTFECLESIVAQRLLGQTHD